MNDVHADRILQEVLLHPTRLQAGGADIDISIQCTGSAKRSIWVLSSTYMSEVYTSGQQEL
eukprot:4408589-Amphidinium_carterae.1